MKISRLPYILLALSTSSMSATLTIDSPCGAKPWLTVTSSDFVGASVGEMTIKLLNKNQIRYEGSEAGILTINQSLKGDAALEVISDSEMRAYGWCYRFNGIEPGLYANEIMVTSPGDSIEWFFGFAHYRDGEWISMCEPTATAKPAFVCGLGLPELVSQEPDMFRFNPRF